MDLQLKDKVAIVSGAASGIGLETVKLLTEEGATVVGGDLQVRPLVDLGVTSVESDLSTEEGNRKLVDTALQEHGRIDILVNNVGIFPYREGFLSTSIEDWKRTMEVNFYSMVRLTREVLPHMVRQGSGSIVSIASECGRQPDVFFVDYSVTKAAILNLSKALANEFGPQGIRSNVVSPGPTRTPAWDKPGGMIDSLAEDYGMEREASVEHFAKVVRQLPTGKLGSPKDVAAAVAFLASGISNQVTGAEYTVNGGSYIAA